MIKTVVSTGVLAPKKKFNEFFGILMLLIIMLIMNFGLYDDSS